MFAVYCRHCRRRMLLPLDHIDALHRTDDGFDVEFRCLHAHHGTWSVRTRRAPA